MIYKKERGRERGCETEDKLNLTIVILILLSMNNNELKMKKKTKRAFLLYKQNRNSSFFIGNL